MLGREKNIREEIEKTGDEGGDLHLELAECLIDQGKFDEACENLLLCLGADTMVRDCAYPMIVDLLARGKCIDLVPHMTFEWLRLDCYIEPEKKKAMYTGIAFGSEKLNKVATAMECYIMDFGGDANVGAMYDRLERVTYEQMPHVDYYDYYYYELARDALCEAVKNGLPLSELSYYWVEGIYFNTDSENVAFECLKHIYESGKREELIEREVFSTVTKDSDIIKNAIVHLLDYYIAEKNYEFVAWIYNDLTRCDNAECLFDFDEVNEKIHDRVYDFVLASEDVKTVATFFQNAEEATYLAADYEQLKALSDFVLLHYFDENGNECDEWKEVPDLIDSVFTIFVDDMFFVAAGEKELEATYGGYDKKILILVFEAYRDFFEKFFEEGSNKGFREEDGKLYFVSFLDYNVLVEDKERFLENLRAVLKMLAEKYFI